MYDTLINKYIFCARFNISVNISARNKEGYLKITLSTPQFDRGLTKTVIYFLNSES